MKTEDNNAPIPLSPPDADTAAFLARLPFTALCRIARDLFQVPVASLCLDDAHWIDLAPGIDPAAWSFATSLAGRPDRIGPLQVVEDVRGAPASLSFPGGDALAEPRFVASAPLGSRRTGRLALFDARPRTFTQEQRRQLEDLAAIATRGLELWQDAREAAEREADFRLLAESSTDTIVRGDLGGIRLYISPSVETLLGYAPDELIGRRAAEIVHPDDVGAFGDMMKLIADAATDIGVCEMRQRHKAGHWVWMEASVRLTRDRVTGEPNGYVASVRGTEQRKQTEARLQYLASHDVLTGLPNRASHDRRLAGTLARAERHGEPFALFSLDIDRFKSTNDTFGHQAGDAVLRVAAERFRAVLRDGDMLARLGGDEFALIHPVEDGAREAALVAERLIAAMAEPVLVRGMSIVVGVSIGIALAPRDGLDAHELTAAADRALYRAKSEGRNTYRFHEAPPAF